MGRIRNRSERCIVTVLAVDVVGSTRHIVAYDDEDARAFFDQYITHIRTKVEQAGGLLFDYSDGGIAVFGWPHAFEDHADRACAAAWAILNSTTLRAPDGSPVYFRAGLHAGLVSIRQTHPDGSARPHVVGAAVNLAAKLQKHAPAGTAFLSADAFKLCRSRVPVTPHSPPDDIQQFLETFSLHGPPPEATLSEFVQRYRTPFVGRDEELNALKRALPAVGAASSCIAIVGEPGIGKSRLAAVAADAAQAANARLITFFGDAQKRSSPFAAARSLVSEAQSSRAQKIVESAPISSLDAMSTGRGRRKGAAATQTQIARSLADTFAAALDGPTLVVVEDLHVVDVESRQFLRMLARTEAPQSLMLLLTSRPEAQRDCAAIAKRVIHLEPLTQHEMRTLARALWHGTSADPNIERAVNRADGVPFVLEELIRALDSSDLRGTDALPRSVESAIHARVNRLTAAAKETAQAMSLLGADMTIDIVGRVAGREAGALARDLRMLEHFSFIHPTSGDSVRFRHQIIADACRNTIPRDRRVQLHAAALETLSGQSGDLRGHYEQLAFHAEGAGLLQQAIDYLWEAGVEARDNSAAASLNAILDRAIELIERIGPQAEDRFVDFVLMTCASMLQLGEFAKMRRLLPRTMELSERQKRQDKVCGTMSQLAMLCWFEGDYTEGVAISERALAIAHELKSMPLIFSTQLMLANNLHGLALMERAIATQRQLCEMLTGPLETARLGAAAVPSSMAHAFLSWFMMETGQYAEGLAAVQRGLSIALRERDAYAEVLARSALAKNLLALNQAADAVECLTIAREIAERNGYDAIHANLSGRIAIAMARTGRAAEAVVIVEACLESGMQFRTGRLEVFYLYAGYAEALFFADRTTDAFDALDTAMGIARDVGNPCFIVEALGLRARLRKVIDARGGVSAELAARLSAYPSAEEDLAERRALCAAHNIVAWDPDPKAAKQAQV